MRPGGIQIERVFAVAAVLILLAGAHLGPAAAAPIAAG